MRKKVGLALGAGSAKGFAHIGVLQELEKAGIQVDMISGSSMGAIIGGIYSVGTDLNLLENDRYDGVTIAAVADDEETLSVLLSLGASAKQVTSRYDGTALIAAAHLGHDGVVRQLIAAGAPLDHVNNLHWTAVIEAIVLGNGGPRHQATLKALLDAGASVKLTDRQGKTPLELARARAYAEMVKMLAAAGAK